MERGVAIVAMTSTRSTAVSRFKRKPAFSIRLQSQLDETWSNVTGSRRTTLTLQRARCPLVP
jgi:hypothetical protein